MTVEAPKQPIVEMAPFTPPAVEIGETVWYYPSGNTNDAPLAATVLETGRGNRNRLWVTQFSQSRWCRHSNDPVIERNINIRTDEGCWTITEHGYKMRELYELLNQPKKKADEKPKG